MSFDDAGVPGQRQAGDDGVAISVDAGREGAARDGLPVREVAAQIKTWTS
ncbi:hypothetical protein [Streptomyces nigra]